MKKNKVVDYYENLESRIGYKIFTWDTKHFGYYPPGKKNIDEKEAQRLMMDLVAEKLKLKNTDLVLDAGCGRGTTSCYLAQSYGVSIIGIDIVPFELDMAKRRAEKMQLKDKTKFYLEDYSNTGFPDNYFDKIFTLETLVHSPNFRKTLREFRRILKPGGKLALFEYTRSPDREFTPYEKKLFYLVNEVSSMRSFNKFFHNSFTEDIRGQGFILESDGDITKNFIPSIKRFYNIARIPYFFIKLFGLQKYFINTTSGAEFYNIVKKGLVRYRTVVVKKPKRLSRD